MSVTLLTIGEIVIFIGIIGTLYKVFDLYYKTRNKYEELANRICKLEQKYQDNETIKIAVQSMLKDRIIQQYRHFIERNKISILDKDNISTLYKNYKILNGNGAVEGIYKELMELPVEIIK